MRRTIAIILLWVGSVFAQDSVSNSIRIIDGNKYALSAAGINQADSNLGSGGGEIWVPKATRATDAQISIGIGHVLKVFQSLTIGSPILLNSYARLICPSNGSVTPGATGQIIASQNMAQMVRGTAQDGTEESWYVDTCSFNGGGKTFTSGVIDLTGINDRTHIYDATIYNYKSTVGGIYSTTAGTNGRGSGHLEIKNVWLDPGLSNSGSTCLLLDTSASTVAFTEEIILDGIECQNSTAKYPIEFRNTNTPVSPTMRGIWAKHVTIEGTSAATSQLYLNGVNDSHFEDIFCDGTAINCVDIANTKNNYAISIFDIEAPISGLTNTLIDRLNNFTIAQSGALGTSHVQHYTVAGTASLGANYSRWYQTTPLVVTGLKLADQGQCQMVSGACSAQSLSHTYASAPNCVATWTGKGTLTNGGLKIASTTTTVTPSSSTNTDTAVVNWVCFGN